MDLDTSYPGRGEDKFIRCWEEATISPIELKTKNRVEFVPWSIEPNHGPSLIVTAALEYTLFFPTWPTLRTVLWIIMLCPNSDGRIPTGA